VNIAFTLPPGSYATLVVKRLFHFSFKKESDFEGVRYTKPVDAPKPKQFDDEGDEVEDDDDDENTAESAPRPAPRRGVQPPKPAPAPVAVVSPRVVEPVRKRGFLERQRDKKQLTDQRRRGEKHN
jgi:tRNA pseudouridine13 synthase